MATMLTCRVCHTSTIGGMVLIYLLYDDCDDDDGHSRNQFVRNEGSNAEQKSRTAIWQSWLAIGSNAGGSLLEHDIPLYAISVTGNVQQCNDYAWNRADPTTIFVALPRSNTLYDEYEHYIQATIDVWTKYRKSQARSDAAKRAAATRATKAKAK